MPTVKLVKAVRLPGFPLRPAGYVMDVPQDVVDRFSALGVFAGDEPESAAEPVEQAKPSAVEVEPEPKPKRVNRPRRSAPLAEWRKFAESQGISVKGLSKQDLIAATN